MAKTIVGLFDDLNAAEQAVRDLTDNGFNRSDISVIARERNRGADYPTDTERKVTRTGEGAVAGAGTGAVLGGLAGLVVGLTALAIPGIGPIIAAGPLVTTLAGASAGAVAGGIVGGLVGAGVPEEEANAYAEGVRRGGTLITVRTSDDMAGQARDIIRRYNPVDIHSRSEYWRQGNWQGFDESGQPFSDEDTVRERDYWRANAPTASRYSETSAAGYGTPSAGGARYDETAGMGTTGTDYSTAAPRSNESFERGTTGARYDETTGTGTGTSGTRGMNAGETFDRETGAAGYDATTGAGRPGERFDREADYRQGSTSTGRGYSGMRRDFNDYSSDFRSDFNTTYRTGGHDFGYYEPAYRYGYDLAATDRYRGRQWSDFEGEARYAWEQTHAGSPWDDVKDAVRHAWERVTGE